ncbi:NAD-dependent epimerase/dehydratase family protein [Roseicyclus sp. F158]|uniref:NAD-dependent epimerase/dehydratase family protein n=1 Tax=Tropicimonas omnivorans TaxID=3075590 RepID=A0ABU3DES0_9RHOB|nr:NAD-dependent epimerase/dehydratase family protein [Roseicyclus sp. F158]MDT0682220.1 NAD-dependent epimerase/dehydratase family protein [Roseicyclus sp. F158]
MPKTVLLTGITGFIAKHVAKELLMAGHTVRGSLRSPNRAEEVREALRPVLDDPDALDRLSFVELDLTRDDGWAAAMEGVDALIHTASPFPMSQPGDPEELIRPAVDGAMRALSAAHAAGVERVVMTSSSVAIMYCGKDSGSTLGEGDWTDPEHPTANAYAKSKTLAERAAWDFVGKTPGMKLTTVNPGLVAGIPLDDHYGTSLRLVERFLSGKDPMVPDVGMPVVDVEDVARLHVRALDYDSSIGHRLIASSRWLSLIDIAQHLASLFPERGIPKRRAPTFALRIMGIFDPTVRQIVPTVGYHYKVDTSAANAVLGREFVPAKAAIEKSARYLTERPA